MNEQEKQRAHFPKTDRAQWAHLRGTLTENASLGAQSWFRCGGTADLLFEPADLEDLQNFLQSYKNNPPSLEGGGQGEGLKSHLATDIDHPHPNPPPTGGGNIVVIGGLANTIIRDGGVRGCVIRLGKPFADVQVLDGAYIQAGAGALNGTVAAAAARAGIGGLEFLSGIPGSVGGALAMNAGAYGREVKDVFIEGLGIHHNGKTTTLLSPHKRGSAGDEEKGPRFRGEGDFDLEMSYRKTNLSPDIIVTSALFKGTPEDKETVKSRLKDIKQKRASTQPIAEKTGGSTFANPSDVELEAAGLPAGTRAWEVIEKVGGRGFSIGGAQMSEKHCNFMINTGSATAADLENLGEEMRKRAREELGLELHWEIKRIGEKT